MQNLAKKQWSPSITLKQSSEIMIDWCIRARDKKILRKSPPKIYYSYILEDTPPLQFMQNVSLLFKYSQKDVPYFDYARDIILRELSVALKAHFFIFPNDKVAHEPYFFAFPSLEDSNKTIFGLIYKVEKENKNILVCEKDLKGLFENNKILFEFPTVVMEDSFKWYSMKHWNKIKQEAGLSENSEKPWINVESASLAKEALSGTELLKVATILDVPYEMKDMIKPLGIDWNKHVKTWYLPKGFDVESVSEYIGYMKKEMGLV